MSEKRFRANFDVSIYDSEKEEYISASENGLKEIAKRMNEQQELIEELHISDHMGWDRAEKFEKELKQKKIYIKRLEYKVQKFKEMNGEQQDTITNLQGDVNRLQYIVEELRKDNYEKFKKINDLEKKSRVLSAYLLSDECALTNNQLKKIIKELKND